MERKQIYAYRFIPIGISNIGGDVMRSKTAEFERMLEHQNKQSSQMQHGGQSGETRSSNSTTKQSNSIIARNGPIYKRRDVISSALNTKK